MSDSQFSFATQFTFEALFSILEFALVGFIAMAFAS